MIGLLLAAVAPFLFAAEQSGRSPVEVEALSGTEASRSQSPGSSPASSADDEVIEYRQPIEESSGGDYGQFETQRQLQLLQQEVLDLRGKVEELSYQLDRMRSRQEDRYLELDGRFQDLQDQVSKGGSSARSDASGAGITNVPDPSDVVTSEGDEQAMYDTALELIRKSPVRDGHRTAERCGRAVPGRQTDSERILLAR
ncbi:MAG: YbgF trimerization domain-containing protein [Gammaproteobacteria bacterium]|nr:YbgF trimerization domain-containing protein [Gammaproteobacteria bacterium]